MDDNPWGAPSAPSSPHLDPTSSPLQQQPEPRLSIDVDDQDDLAPPWGNASPSLAPAPGDDAVLSSSAVTKGEMSEGAATADTDDGSEAPAIASLEEAALPATADDEASTPSPSPPPPAHTASPEPASPPHASPPVSPPKPTVTLPSLSLDDSLLDEGPPMDDFDDEPAPSGNGDGDGDGDDFGAPAGGTDDFDDFGSVGGGGDEDDFGDFGDFGDAAPLDEAAFGAPPPAAPPALAPTAAPSAAYPPLRLDLSTTARQAVAPQLRDFFAEAWPASLQAVNDDPERQVEGPAQVLVTESSRNLLSTLSTLPPLKPLDWRRSRIRREHLISMGIPVNLDESTEPKISALSLSASLHPPSRPSSAPPLAGSPLPFRSSSPASTPYGALRASASRSRAAHSSSPAPPTFDRARADELVALAEEDLTLLGLDKLRAVSDELERISVEASGALTHALMMREKEGQDKEVYNGMIQDLVVASAKIKTSSPALGKAPQRQGSGRWKLSGSVK
ncbi:hypothetical protein DMC30DRAFT_387699 [Rhodotorula diobovata]|uniref:Uncharacterized protein n=1 Tax=Rhodotorula diobovata TaxID=5288 RepID=A0A5C5G6X5_9BASI|nr:hypothetical protein DMC30DRAFT_387699 [Rhodotorula diobovata]